MRKFLFCSLFVALNTLTVAAWGASAVGLSKLRCEYFVNPLGIDTTSPRLLWVLESDQRGQGRTAYRVLVSSTAKTLAANKGDLWGTGKIASDQTTFVEYAGSPLTSRARCFWKVRVWDRKDAAKNWSEPAKWTVGLMNREDAVRGDLACPPRRGLRDGTRSVRAAH